MSKRTVERLQIFENLCINSEIFVIFLMFLSLYIYIYYLK